MTAEDLYDLPHDENGYELASGLLIRMPPAGTRHGKIGVRIGRLLDEYVESHDLGCVCGADTGFILQRAPDIVRAPDVAFVSRERLATVKDLAFFCPIAPDLAVEVVSPSDRVTALEEKIREYFVAGTRLVWVVYPDTATVHVYRSPVKSRALGAEDQLEGEDVLPGFVCPVRRCFD